MRRWIAIGTATAATVAGVGLLATTQASAASKSVKAVLEDVDGDRVGTVTFTKDGSAIKVKASFVKNSDVPRGAFHGFHIHANNIDSNDALGNGKGCKASGSDATKWFLSADGHYNAKLGETHGTHGGDMPSVLIRKNGKGDLSFTTDRIKFNDLEGKAVMLHRGPDNFGNIPLGGGTGLYTANDTAATEKTSKTGNAGDRVACGVIKD